MIFAGKTSSENMSTSKYHKLSIEAEYSPFVGMEKKAVLQEVRVFNDPQLDAKRCVQVITKLLYLINQGETLTKVEVTEVFFAVTKLFRSKNARLKRMVYLIIKELSPSADEVIILTNSLMKDMSSKTDVYRVNAVRILCRIIAGVSCSITDGFILDRCERYIKQAIVDESPVVASAVLVSGIHLLQTNPDIVKRWIDGVLVKARISYGLVQFHKFTLTHQIQQKDCSAVRSFVKNLTYDTCSSLTECLIVRYASQAIRESIANGQYVNDLCGYLVHALSYSYRASTEMAIFEAARAIIELSGVNQNDLGMYRIGQTLPRAITVLQTFLSKSKPVLRFAAVRTLNKVAMTNPLAFTNCDIDMESLISDLESLILDQNRSIATLAIITLLKIRNESSVDWLMMKITNLMLDITDDLKIFIVEAIQSMCLKFPQKYQTLMKFLSNIRIYQGGFEYKKAIVDSFFILIRDIPEAKETGLSHLCDFIEDCDYTYLSTQILHFLGNEGPRTADPNKYIRYIYNRVILGNATVKASAVSALAKFGALVDSLKPRMLVLLQRYLDDSDNEVRDRANRYLNALVKSVSETWEKLLASIPEFADFGKLLKSSLPVELTEAETEYAVNVVKHIYPSHVVFQYNCTNTIPQQVLENVHVIVDASNAEEFFEVASKPLKSLPYDSPGHVFVAFAKPEGACSTGKFSNMLKFIVKEVDPSTREVEDEGVEDEYHLEDLEMTSADGVSNLENAWDSLGADNEPVDEYGLGVRESLAEAIQAVI